MWVLFRFREPCYTMIQNQELHLDIILKTQVIYCNLYSIFFINHVQVLQQVISAEIFELANSCEDISKNAKNIMKTLYVHTFH